MRKAMHIAGVVLLFVILTACSSTEDSHTSPEDTTVPTEEHINSEENNQEQPNEDTTGEDSNQEDTDNQSENATDEESNPEETEELAANKNNEEQSGNQSDEEENANQNEEKPTDQKETNQENTDANQHERNNEVAEAPQPESNDEERNQAEGNSDKEGTSQEKKTDQESIDPAESEKFTRYTNGRFGYRIYYPKDWNTGDEAPNGDGRILHGVDNDDIDIRVYGSHYFERKAPDLSEYESITFNNGDTAKFKETRKDGTYSFDVVKIENEKEYRVEGKFTEVFYQENKAEINAVIKSFQIFTVERGDEENEENEKGREENRQ